MTSNAYIASDGANVMKVGKANDVRRREKQIAIPMTLTIACLDEAAAFRVESQLRNFVIKQGGIRHQGTIDWFRFDAQIYAMLCEFAAQVDSQAVFIEEDLDREISRLRARYHQLLFEEHSAEVAAQIVEIKRLRAELAEECKAAQERIIQLSKQAAVLEYQLEQLRGKEDKDE